MLQAERDGLLIILLGALALMAAIATLAFGLLAAPTAVAPAVPLTVTVGGATPLPPRPRGSSPGQLPALPTSTLLGPGPTATVEIVLPTEAATMTPAEIVTPTLDPLIELTVTAAAGSATAAPPGQATATFSALPLPTSAVPPPTEPTATPPGYPAPPTAAPPPLPTAYP